MPATSPHPVALRWQPVADALAEFREECLGFEFEIGSLLDEVERLHGEIDRGARDLATRSRDLDSAWREVFAAREELNQTRAELKLAREALVAAACEPRVAEPCAPSSEPRAADSPGSPEVESLFAEIESERAALEAELELVRGRAAELYNVVAEQKRDMAKQRDETSAELKNLRKLVEKQSEILAAQPISVSEPPVDESRSVAKAVAESPADPVVNSVMAQFAKLQQDVAQRRKNKK